MQHTSLEDLFVDQLSHLYDVEEQILKALPVMAKAARHQDLKEAFETHYDQTKLHIERLDDIFEHHRARPKSVTDMAIRGLLMEGRRLMATYSKSAARDAGLIAAAQKVEHFEIAAYGTARTYAQQLGYREAASLLNRTIKEEGEADKILTNIAETHINRDARAAGFSASVARQGGSVEDDGFGWAAWLFGLGIGVAVSMLYAPKPGSETRQLLRERAMRGKDYVAGSASDLIERGREMIGRQHEEMPQP